MKNLLKFLLIAVFLFGVTPTNTVAQEVVEQQCTTAKQCCDVVLADADVKKKKKKLFLVRLAILVVKRVKK